MKNLFYKKTVLVIFILLTKCITAQEVKQDSTRHQADFKTIIKGKQVIFKAELSPLRQIAGAPKAYWENYWEFGDGDYSLKENPTHTYKDAGTYTARLAATNNYDDGKPPTTRPKSIFISNTETASNEQDILINEDHKLIALHNGFRIQNNREPSPNQEMQLIVSYANDKKITTNGTLYLFFNDKKFKNKNFELIDIRTYYNEKEIGEDALLSKALSKNTLIQSTGITSIIENKNLLKDTLSQNLQQSLNDAKNNYYDYKAWYVSDVAPNEERNMFFTLKTTPEMLKDTSAILTIRSIYVPERGSTSHKITEKEMEIVVSHDPNKMSVYNSKLNYRLVRFKRLKYKIRFQNNGEGPASLIKLNTEIPEMLDKYSLKVLDMYPKVPICPDGKEVRYSCIDTVFYKDKISFQFKNIYLPGSNQKNVFEKDSTKGFVKYSLKFAKDFHKVRSKSKTEIIFDKNPPIVTNTSTASFKPGISIGAKAGYNHFFTSDEKLGVADLESDTKYDTSANGFFVGVTISPFKAYKWYWQSEIMASVQYIESKNFETIQENANGITTTTETKNNIDTQKKYLDIVPVSVRYNINSIIGLGFGPQVSINGWQKSILIKDQTITQSDAGQVFNERNNYHREAVYKKELTINNYGLFLDFTVGASRIGPSVGLRYIQNFTKPTKQLQAYAIWKF